MEAAVFLSRCRPASSLTPTAESSRSSLGSSAWGPGCCRVAPHMAALRPLGVVGHRVHLHERRVPGLDHRRGRSRADPGCSSGVRACPTRERCWAWVLGPDRTQSVGGRRRGGAVSTLRAGASRDAETGFRRRPGGAQGAFGELGPRRSRATLRSRAPGAADAARNRVLHRNGERGVRPAQRGALHPRDRPPRRRPPRPGGLVGASRRSDAVRLLRGRALQRRFERRGTEGSPALFGSRRCCGPARLRLHRLAAVAVALLVALLARQLLPALGHWVNQQITDSSVRATVNSIPARPTRSARRRGPVLGLVEPLRNRGALGVGACS